MLGDQVAVACYTFRWHASNMEQEILGKRFDKACARWPRNPGLCDLDGGRTCTVSWAAPSRYLARLGRG